MRLSLFLKTIRLKAKKSFGQHFLHREDIASGVAGALKQVKEVPRILEIGPGKGMLTKYLKNIPAAFKMVEADQDMIAFLRKNYPSWSDDIIEGDFLSLNLSQIFEGKPFLMIGNFPYNISSQIVFRLIQYRAQIPELVGMFQKEMAVRIVSQPGSKDYGVISVLTQAYFTGELLFDVDKSSFKPPPKVQSAVIRLERKPALTLDCNESLFKSVVKQAFNQRRKMLRNSLKSLFPNADLMSDSFFNQRPEDLSLSDYISITKQIESLRIDSAV